MTSLPMDSRHGRMASGVACNHRPWTENAVEQRWAWHDVTALGLHARSDNVGRSVTSPPLESTHSWQPRAWHAITVLGQHTRSDDVRHDMPSPPLDSTHSRTTSGVACHHRHWEAHTVERRQAWHAVNAFGQHARSDDVGRGMTSQPLVCTHDRTMSSMA